MTKVTEHEYLLPLDGQTIDGTAYKRLGTTTLPNLNGRYLRADTTPGTMVEAGLPNITGTFKVCGAAFGGIDDTSGAFYPILQSKGGNTLTTNMTDYPDSTYGNFDASKSSSIYGKSDTVTPLTYTVRAYICYA